MRHASSHRLPFDADLDFVALKNIRVSGVEVAAGETLDKSLVTPRRLRQMYEAPGLLRYADGQVPKKPAPRPRSVAIGPTELPSPETIDGGPREKKGGVVRRVRSRRAA